jgi:hypothetical protein
MASALLRHALKPISGLAWKPLNFSKQGTASVLASKKVEEEALPGYVATRYYPVRIVVVDVVDVVVVVGAVLVCNKLVHSHEDKKCRD